MKDLRICSACKWVLPAGKKGENGKDYFVDTCTNDLCQNRYGPTAVSMARAFGGPCGIEAGLFEKRGKQ